MRLPLPDDGARAPLRDAAAEAEAQQALRLARELRQAVRRERETVRRLSEYLAAKATVPGPAPRG